MNIIACKNLFISLLTALIVEDRHVLNGIYDIFFKKRPRPNLEGFWYKIWISVKRSGKQLSCKTNFSIFLKLIALILGSNCIKGLRVAKIVKQIKFEGSVAN